MGKFNLNGEVYTLGTKFGAKIRLTTPDGNITELDSQPCYSSSDEAKAALENRLNEILKEFSKDGTYVASRNGVDLS